MPLNITVNSSGMATVDWIFEHIPGTTSYCKPNHVRFSSRLRVSPAPSGWMPSLRTDPLPSSVWFRAHVPSGCPRSLTVHRLRAQEEGLHVSVSSSGQWLAKGLGTGDAYYSLEAQLVGDKLTNGVVYASGK